MDQSPAHDLISADKVESAEPPPIEAAREDQDQPAVAAASVLEPATVETDGTEDVPVAQEAATAAEVAEVAAATVPETVEDASSERATPPTLQSTQEEIREEVPSEEPIAPVSVASPMDEAATEPLSGPSSGEAIVIRPQSPEPVPHGKKRGRESAPSSSLRKDDQDGREGSSSTSFTPVAKKGKRVETPRKGRSPSRGGDATEYKPSGSPSSSAESYADDIDTQNEALVRDGSPKRRRNTPPAGDVDIQDTDTQKGKGRGRADEGPEVKGVRKKVEDMDVYEREEAQKQAEEDGGKIEEEDTVVVDAKDAAAEPINPAPITSAEPASIPTTQSAEPTTEAATPAPTSPSKAADAGGGTTGGFSFAGYTPWKPASVDNEAASLFGSSPAPPPVRAFGSSPFGGGGGSAFGGGSSGAGFGSKPFGSASKDSASAGAGAFGSSAAGAKGGFGGFSSWATKVNGFAGSKSVFDQPEPASKDTLSVESKTATTDSVDSATTKTNASGVAKEPSWVDQLQSDKEAEKEKVQSHLAMGGVTEADRLPGFVPQQTLTGEEGWTLLKTVRCKLYEFGQDKNWHEAGTGMLRLLRDQDLESRYRLVMRTDAVFRVILNQTISTAFRVESREGRYLNLNFVGAMYLAKFGQQKTVDDFHSYLKRCMEHVNDPDGTDIPDPER